MAGVDLYLAPSMRAELGLSLRGHREVWQGGARDQPRLSPNAPSQCKRTLRTRAEHKLLLPQREIGKGLQVQAR